MNALKYVENSGKKDWIESKYKRCLLPTKAKPLDGLRKLVFPEVRISLQVRHNLPHAFVQ